MPINLQASLADGTISGNTDSTQDWETLLPNSQNTVNVGGILFGSLDSTSTPSATVAGVQCALTTAGG
jgi:hypothetical protein